MSQSHRIILQVGRHRLLQKVPGAMDVVFSLSPEIWLSYCRVTIVNMTRVEVCCFSKIWNYWDIRKKNPTIPNAFRILQSTVQVTSPPAQLSRLLLCIFVESWNHEGCKRPLRSLSPTFILALPPCSPQTVSSSALATHFLNTSRGDVSTSSLASLFQRFSNLSINFFFLIFDLNFSWFSLGPFPLMLSLVTWEKRPTPTSLQPPFREL